MAKPSRILDSRGRPLASASAENAFQGARYDRALQSWSPALRSADADLLPDQRTLMARAYDLSRNYPLASGGIQIHLDNIIGSGLRLSSKPDYRALGQDADWASQWSREVESRFRLFADDHGAYLDAGRRLTFSALLGLAYRQFLTAGEILASAEWLPGRGGRFATALQMIEPARLCNPSGIADSARLRAGVEMDYMGAPLAYHIRSALQSDSRYGADTTSWRRVPSETPWGRAQIIHVFEVERAGQTRGKSGLATIIANSFRLGKYQDISMEAATVNAMYAATIETEFDYTQAMQALGRESDTVAHELAIQTGAAARYYEVNDNPIKLDGVRIPHLFPGEKLTFATAQHPGPNFAEFEASFLRNLAAGWNLTYEQLSRDYSKTNYSGARAGLQEAWKFFSARRELIGGRFASAIFSLWLEEAIDKGDVTLPPRAPDFHDAKAAYCRARWIGPGKGHIDPLKENKADELELDMGTLTLEDACAARGRDWEENLEQIAREQQRLKQLGLDRPAAARGYLAPEPKTEGDA